jgi:twitching motility protein PilU
MEKSENIGMKTFDSALFDLYRAGKISLEEALKNADSENNLRLKISLAESERGKGVTDEEASGGLSLTPKQED